MTTALVILGWVAAAASVAGYLPQLIRILRVRVTAGVSLLLWQLSCLVAIGWTMHGSRLMKANMIVPNVLCVIIALAILVLLRRDRHLTWWRVLPLAIVAGLAWGGLDWLVPPAVFGLIMLAPALVGQVFQTRDLLLSADIRGVSIGYLLLNLTTQVVWVTWSLMAGDPAITWCGTLTGLAVLVNIGLFIARRSGKWQPRPADDSGSHVPSVIFEEGL